MDAPATTTDRTPDAAVFAVGGANVIGLVIAALHLAEYLRVMRLRGQGEAIGRAFPDEVVGALAIVMAVAALGFAAAILLLHRFKRLYTRSARIGMLLGAAATAGFVVESCFIVLLNPRLDALSVRVIVSAICLGANVLPLAVRWNWFDAEPGVDGPRPAS